MEPDCSLDHQAMLESDVQASKRVKPKPKTAAAKQLAAVKRKAKGFDSDEESEEDYKPTKAAAKAKKLTPVKRKVQDLELLDDSEDDHKVIKPPPAKKIAPAKAAPVKKPAAARIEVLDDSPKPVVKKASNGKAASGGAAKAKPAASAKPKKKITLDSESEDDFKMDQDAADDS